MDRGNLEFRDNADDYIVLTVVHIKYLAIFFIFVGLVAVVAVFSCGFAFFPWALYDTSFDVIALLGFFIFLVFGLGVHWLAFYSIHTTKYRLMIPVLLFHCFLIALEAITVLIAIGQLVADQSAAMDENDLAARYVLISNPICILFGALMIYIMMRTRVYLRNKRRHIRNGLPPPVMEVSREAISFRNKIFNSTDVEGNLQDREQAQENTIEDTTDSIQASEQDKRNTH